MNDHLIARMWVGTLLFCVVVTVLLVAMLGCERVGGGELLEPKNLIREYDTERKSVSVLNAIDKECLLPLDVLGDKATGKYWHYVYKEPKMEKGEIKMTYYGGRPAYKFNIDLDLSTFRCLEKGTNFWVYYSRLSRALDRASDEMVRGRFDNIEWEEIVVEPMRWSDLPVAHQEYRK